MFSWWKKCQLALQNACFVELIVYRLTLSFVGAAIYPANPNFKTQTHARAKRTDQ